VIDGATSIATVTNGRVYHRCQKLFITQGELWFDGRLVFDESHGRFALK
jgi:hypothetical protein